MANASDLTSTPSKFRQRLAKRKRSDVTSGRRLFIDGNPTSAWSRRYADLIGAHVADLGGVDAQLSLIKRASAIEPEQIEGKLSRGEDVDIDRYQRATNTLRRTPQALGLERKPRPVESLDKVLQASSSGPDDE